MAAPCFGFRNWTTDRRPMMPSLRSQSLPCITVPARPMQSCIYLCLKPVSSSPSCPTHGEGRPATCIRRHTYLASRSLVFPPRILVSLSAVGGGKPRRRRSSDPIRQWLTAVPLPVRSSTTTIVLLYYCTIYACPWLQRKHAKRRLQLYMRLA